MTTLVRIEARCESGREIVVETRDEPLISQQTLQDGEELELHVWDTRSVRIFEQLK